MSYYINSTLTGASSFATGRGYLISFVYQLTSKAFTLSLQAAISDFRVGGNSRIYPKLLFRPTAFQYASFHCGLSIAAVQFSFNGEVGLNTAYIGLWI